MGFTRLVAGWTAAMAPGEALALPKPARGRPILLRADPAGATHVEDRIRSAKATGLRNLPFWGFAANDAWLSLVGIAQTLVCWAQGLLLDGDCKLAEPKTLGFRLWDVAGPDRPPRPPRHRPHRPHLALGHRPGDGVRQAACPARPLLTLEQATLPGCEFASATP
jgi:hypothetical protein